LSTAGPAKRRRMATAAAWVTWRLVGVIAGETQPWKNGCLRTGSPDELTNFPFAGGIGPEIVFGAELGGGMILGRLKVLLPGREVQAPGNGFCFGSGPV